MCTNADCHHDLSGSSQLPSFCPACASRVITDCPNCKKDLAEMTTRCEECGSSYVFRLTTLIMALCDPQPVWRRDLLISQQGARRGWTGDGGMASRRVLQTPRGYAVDLGPPNILRPEATAR